MPIHTIHLPKLHIKPRMLYYTITRCAYVYIYVVVSRTEAILLLIRCWYMPTIYMFPLSVAAVAAVFLLLWRQKFLC